MTYTVVKTIKGRQYLYHQVTWREAKKVRTKSWYIGPLVHVLGAMVTALEPPSEEERINMAVERARDRMQKASDEYARMQENNRWLDTQNIAYLQKEEASAKETSKPTPSSVAPTVQPSTAPASPTAPASESPSHSPGQSPGHSADAPG